MNDKEILAKAFGILGKRTSEKKKAACRANGKLGGWPKGRKRKKK